MKKLKKTMFMFAGLIVIAAGFVFGKLYVVEASIKSGQKFGDWVVSCAKDNKQQEICLLTQQYSVTKDDKTQVIAVLQLGYFGTDKVLKLFEIVPLGVNLESGTSIISVDKLIAPAKFFVCDAGGCQAKADLSADDIKALTSNSPNSLAMIGGDGKQINIPISNNGLKEGLEALSKK